MKKKAPAKVKRSVAKSKKTKKVAKRKGRVITMAAAPRPRPSFRDDPRFAQAVQNYQAGIQAMQHHKFGRARTLLEKAVNSGVREIADRAAVHLNTCTQQLAHSSTSFKTPEEHYDYAVSLMNSGDYDEARAHMEKILKHHSKADYAQYGLGVLACLSRHYEDALRHLAEAIRMNPQNRYQARNDTDFQDLADDPRFTELLYPEEGTPPASGAAPWMGNRR